MDAPRGESVTAAFIEFHRQGLIYRDVRLTNGCCALRSGISDIEVDYLDIEKRTKLAVPGHPKERTYAFGVIWSFAYKLEGSDEEIVVATPRPETLLGDAAVAVPPPAPPLLLVVVVVVPLLLPLLVVLVLVAPVLVPV